MGIYVQEVVLGGLASQCSLCDPALINSRSLRVSWEAERSSCLSNCWGPTVRHCKAGRKVGTRLLQGEGQILKENSEE